MLGDLPAWLAAVWGLARTLRQSHRDEVRIARDRRVAAAARALVHDLDNALMPLRCRLEVLEQRIASEPDLAQLRSIGLGLDHLGRLGRALRERIANGGEHDTADESTCLHRWWRRYKPLLRSMLPEDALLQALLPPSLPQLRISEVDLVQVLTNLISNAAKAMTDSPAVVISAVPLLGAASVRVSVADNGCGMSPQTLAAAGIARSEAPSRGSGNGLAIVRSMIEAHGGSFEVESAPGQGTRVHLLLPAATTDILIDGPRVALSLLDRALRLLIHEILQSLGAVVVEVAETIDGIDDSTAACWVIEQRGAAARGRDGASPIDRFLSSDPHRRVLLIGDGIGSSDSRIRVVEAWSDCAALRDAVEALVVESVRNASP
jgi:hypothetical protein